MRIFAELLDIQPAESCDTGTKLFRLSPNVNRSKGNSGATGTVVVKSMDIRDQLLRAAVQHKVVE